MSVHSSSVNSYTPDEMMTIAAARLLWPGCVCFVGIGVPSAAVNLARLTHAPDMVLIYESGAIGTQPTVLPLSIGDGELAETATPWCLYRKFFLIGCRLVGWMSAFSARRRLIASAISIPPL